MSKKIHIFEIKIIQSQSKKSMYNWSVDEEFFKKEDPEGYQIWRIEQLINYGLNEEKLDEKLVRKYWYRLYLDPEAKKYLKFLLWGKLQK